MQNQLQDALRHIRSDMIPSQLIPRLSTLSNLLVLAKFEMGADSVRRICDDFLKGELMCTSLSSLLLTILSKHPLELGELCSVCLAVFVPDSVACGVRRGDRTSIRIRDHLAFDFEYGDYDNDWTACRIWPGGVCLSRLLVDEVFAVKDCKVLELGSGLEIGGISALYAGASRVAFTDYKEEMLEVALRNVQLNGVDVRLASGLVLDWNLPVFSQLQTWINDDEFVVIASEIVYDDTHPVLVMSVLTQLFQIGATRALIVIMSKPTRSGLDEFVKMLMLQAHFKYTISHMPIDDDRIATCINLEQNKPGTSTA